MSSGPKGGSSVTTNVPTFARPFYQELLKQTGLNVFDTVTADTVKQGVINPVTGLAYTDKDIGAARGVKPYQAYEGERVAGFTPGQQATQEEIRGLSTPGQFASATQGAGLGAAMGFDAAAAGMGQALGYKPGDFSAGYSAREFDPSGFSAQNVMGGHNIRDYQMAGPERVASGRAGSSTFTPDSADYYMSPFQQRVSDIAARETQRRADMESAQRSMGAIKGGTFGGSRQALLQAEADRNTEQAIGDIYTRGQQAAYENAQQQFERDQARRMGAQQLNIQSGLQAALANQQAGLTAGQANLSALLQSQGLRADTGLRAALANQQAGLEAQRLGEQSRQFGATFGESSAARAADYAMREQLAREQASQFGAGLGKDIGLAGLQAGLSGSELLGRLGGAEQEANLARLQAQAGVGKEEQALQQAQNDIAYQQAMEARDWQKQQLQFYSDILRGNAGALGSTQVSYAAPPSLASQVGGLGIAGLSLYNAMGR
jgi:hypothetical protein